MNQVVSYLPSIIAAVTGLLSIFSVDVQGYISAHPAVASVIGAIYAVVSHLLPSPAASK